MRERDPLQTSWHSEYYENKLIKCYIVSLIGQVLMGSRNPD